MFRAISLVLLAAASPCGAFTPTAQPTRPLRPLVGGAVKPVVHASAALDPPTPPAAPIARSRALPEFEWPIVFFFVANPLVLLPVAAVAVFLLHLNWAGSLFSVGPAAMRLGALLAVLMLALSFAADRLIPSLAEVTRASQCISLYAMGARRRPLCAAAAAMLISTSAAVAEEVAFRGCMQVGLQSFLSLPALALPAGVAVALAVCVQGVVFGMLHSYSNKYEYLATATVAGIAFGVAFAATANIAVPIVMHFLIDLVGFSACHWQVTRASEDEQFALLESDMPIALQLSAILGPRAAARQQQVLAQADNDGQGTA